MLKQIKSKLEIAENVSLKPYNTFGFNISAELFIQTNCEEQVFESLEWARKNSRTVFPLGRGSSWVLTKDISGLVLVQGNETICLAEENDQYAIVYASAGSSWHHVVLFCIKHQLFGIENLSLIPGTAGAAPMQNIGAYGVELSDVLVSLDAINVTSGEKVQFSNFDCTLGYRNSIFKKKLQGQFIIAGIYLKLSKLKNYHLDYADLRVFFNQIDPSTIKLSDISKKICDLRSSKLPNPSALGNVGSFFKNPIINQACLNKLIRRFESIPFHHVGDKKYKIPAAWLVEKAGWKGYKRGNIGVHTNQSIVLVNYGGGTGKDIIQLANNIRSDVCVQFHINLDIEPVCR